jgi:23S rRNA pseudouridine2605 synthase
MLGVCSRREADRLISSGEVGVNGGVIEELGSGVVEGDVISIRGSSHIFRGAEIVQKVWMYYKPAGYIVTQKDNLQRRTVFEDLKSKINERVISVGRLDLNSEGLLLVTNSGEFARYAESPKTAWERCYKVRIFGEIDHSIIEKLRNGMTVDGINYKSMIVNKIDYNSEVCGPRSQKWSETEAKNPDCKRQKNQWLDCTLFEGKNREIRKLFGHFGIMVNRLIRYKFGPYYLGSIKPGEVIKVGIK